MSQHHGVISRDEGLALGLSLEQMRRRRRRGLWVEVAPGVSRHAACPATWQSKARAAALSVGTAVSHLAAARVWELDGFNQEGIEVVVAEGQHVRRSEFFVHRSINMDLADIATRQGIPVTGIARTVLDVAGVVGHRRLNHTVDCVLRKQLVTWQMLYSVLVRHSARGRNGCGPLRRLLEERFGDQAIPDSKWNRDVGYLITDAGLPEPHFEHEVRHDGKFVARVDLAYPDARLAIECDSVRWHLNKESFVSDPRRRNRLLNAGWQVLSFTWDDYAHHSDRLVADVRSALGVLGGKSVRFAPAVPLRMV